MGNCFQPEKPLPANAYSVKVIDDAYNLQGKAKGFLQITDTNVILTLNRCRPIKWPINHFETYGCAGHVFSIVASEKCPTGEAIYYAFNTEHAQELCDVFARAVSKVPFNGHKAWNKRNKSLNQSQQAGPAAESPASPPYTNSRSKPLKYLPIIQEEP